MSCQQLIKRLDLFDLHDFEQLLTREIEVLAEILIDRLASRRKLGIQNVGDQREATTATSSCSSAVF